MCSQRRLTPLSCFQEHSDFILMILNHEDADLTKDLSAFKNRFQHLWKGAKLKACVDGGINFLQMYNQTQRSTNEEFLVPNLISGDFDSANLPLLTQYKNQGCEIVHTPDQDNTDFTKCLDVLKSRLNGTIVSSIVVLIPEASNRFDHVMANVCTLYKAQELFSPNITVYLISRKSVQFVVPPGENNISIDQKLLGPKFLFLPIAEPSTISTKGLVSNFSNKLFDMATQYQYCVAAEHTVTITTSASILILMHVNEFALES